MMVYMVMTLMIVFDNSYVGFNEEGNDGCDGDDDKFDFCGVVDDCDTIYHNTNQCC